MQVTCPPAPHDVTGISLINHEYLSTYTADSHLDWPHVIRHGTNRFSLAIKL